MELKQDLHRSITMSFSLLIVPYGIETTEAEVPPCEDRTLLIVPYGIETTVLNDVRKLFKLLIVPYGIETTSGAVGYSLIVGTFNRTLWN